MRRNKLPSIFYVETVNAKPELSETDNGGEIDPNETLQAGRPIWSAVTFQPENDLTFKNILLSCKPSQNETLKRKLTCMLSAFKGAGMNNIYYFENRILTQKNLHEIFRLDDTDDSQGEDKEEAYNDSDDDEPSIAQLSPATESSQIIKTKDVENIKNVEEVKEIKGVQDNDDEEEEEDEEEDDENSISQLIAKLESGNVTRMAEKLKETGNNLERWFILDNFAVLEWTNRSSNQLLEVPWTLEQIYSHFLTLHLSWEDGSIKYSPSLDDIRKDKIKFLSLSKLNSTHVSREFFSDLGLTSVCEVALVDSDIDLLQFMPKNITALILNRCDYSKLDFSVFQNLSKLTIIASTPSQLNLKSIPLKTLHISNCAVVSCVNIDSQEIIINKCYSLRFLDSFGDNLKTLKIKKTPYLRKIPELKEPLEKVILKMTGIKIPPALPSTVKFKNLDQIYDQAAEPTRNNNIEYHAIDTETVNQNLPLSCSYGIWTTMDGKLVDNTQSKQAYLREQVIEQMVDGLNEEILTIHKTWPDDLTEEELKFSLKHKKAIELKQSAFTETNLLAMTRDEYCINFEIDSSKILSKLEDNNGCLVLPQLNHDDWIKAFSISPTDLIKDIIFLDDFYWLQLNSSATQHPLLKISYICSSAIVPEFKLKPYSRRHRGCFPNVVSQISNFLQRESKTTDEDKESKTNFPKFASTILAMSWKSQKEKFEFAINQLKDYFLTFTEGDLEDKALEKSQPIFAIIKGHKGACRHRTKGYFLIAQGLFHLEVRIIESPIHSWILIWNPTQLAWMRIDLDGYPAPMLNNAPPLSFQETKSTKGDDFGPPAKYKNLFSPYLDIDTKSCQTAQDLLALALSAAPGNLFIPAAHSPQARGIFRIISQVVKSKFSKQPIFYAESYQQFINGLSWTRIKPRKSPEKIIGLGGKVLNQSGFLVVYLKNFSIPDIVKFMNLLEVKPSFVHPRFCLEISSQLKVIVLLADNSYYAPLVTRDGQHLKWPKKIPVPTYHVLDSSSIDDKSTVIDLSSHLNKWQDICFGNFIFTENGYEYKPGKLSPTESTIQWIVTSKEKEDDDFQYFLTLLGVTHQLNINGEMVDFNINHWSFLSETKEEIVLTHLDPLSGENISLTEQTKTKTDLFYVDSATQHKLFQHLIINQEGQLKKKPGWAQLPPDQKKSRKIIVDLRSINKKTTTVVKELDPLATQHITYLTVDQCELKKNQPIQDLDEIKKFGPGAWIVTTTDPSFISNYIQHRLKTDSEAKTTIYLIDSTFRGFELVSWDQEKSKSFDFHYQHQLLRITQQWIAGENIILQGTLSPYAYSAMLTTLNKMANIWLKNSDKPVLLTGTLIAVIPPSHVLDRRHLAIAALNGRYFEISTEALLAEYAKQVLIDIPGLIKANFEKIELLLKIIAKLPKLSGSPPHPPISYQRTLGMIAALDEKEKKT